MKLSKRACLLDNIIPGDFFEFGDGQVYLKLSPRNDVMTPYGKIKRLHDGALRVYKVDGTWERDPEQFTVIEYKTEEDIPTGSLFLLSKLFWYFKDIEGNIWSHQGDPRDRTTPRQDITGDLIAHTGIQLYTPKEEYYDCY